MVQGAKGTNMHKSVMPVHTVVNKNTIRLLLNRVVDWINFKLSGNMFHKRLPLYFNDLFLNVVHGVDKWKLHLSLVSWWWISLFWVK